MSVYSELLRMTLREEEQPVPGLAELIAQALRRRAELDDTPVEAVANVGSSLAYDSALVRLCHRLGVQETLTDGADLETARSQAEQRLAELLPAIRGILGRREQG